MRLGDDPTAAHTEPRALDWRAMVCKIRKTIGRCGAARHVRSKTAAAQTGAFKSRFFSFWFRLVC